MLTVILSAAASAFWFAVVPNWRPSLKDGERYGVDVSAHQGDIDWERVASDDISFSYIKATEGGDFTDGRFNENWVGADRAGLDRGAYHFFTLCRPGDEQARHFLEVAPPDPDALAPAVDLELGGNCRDRPSRRYVDAELRAFLRIVDDAWGRPAVLYVRGNWDSRYPVRALDHDLWLARFLRRPSRPWQIWQLHGFAKVEGIRGRVDLDIARSR